MESADPELRDYTYAFAHAKEEVIHHLKHVSPSSHPTVIDLGAGKRSGAAIVLELGWRPKNITCIDIDIDEEPIKGTEDVSVIKYDLRKLLTQGKEMPEEISNLKHMADIVLFLGNVHFSPDKAKRITDYFKKGSSSLVLDM